MTTFDELLVTLAISQGMKKGNLDAVDDMLSIASEFPQSVQSENHNEVLDKLLDIRNKTQQKKESMYSL
jgi:hypothetical protein